MTGHEALANFLDGTPLSKLPEGTESVIRAELQAAVNGASKAIEQTSAMHTLLDAWVSARDNAPAPADEWARGFDAGHVYGAQRAQLLSGLVASAIVASALTKAEPGVELTPEAAALYVLELAATCTSPPPTGIRACREYCPCGAGRDRVAAAFRDGVETSACACGRVHRVTW